MPLVPWFGIYHMPVSREFAREWQFNGLPTSRSCAFCDRRVTGVTGFGPADFWTISGKAASPIGCCSGLLARWGYLNSYLGISRNRPVSVWALVASLPPAVLASNRSLEHC